MKLAVFQQIHAVEGQFLLRVFITFAQTKGRIGEVKGAIGFINEIVRTVEALSLIAIGENGPFSIFFDSYDSAISVSCEDDPALTIERHAIRSKQSNHVLAVIDFGSGFGWIGTGEPRRLDRDENLAVRRPLINSVCRNIAEKQVPALTYPNRTFSK